MAEFKAFLRVHKPDCVRCGHLVDFAPERFDPCHYSKGNEDCPARTVTITVAFDQGKLVERLYEAQTSGNWEVLAGLMTQLNGLPEDQRQEVVAELERRKTASASSPAPSPSNGPESGPPRSSQRVAGRS